jgi:hypothetical protein
LARQISVAYGIQLEDVSVWISQTEWATGPKIQKRDIENTQKTLMELGLIEKKLEAEFFIEPSLAVLIDA